jgi:hypothetical protein
MAQLGSVPIYWHMNILDKKITVKWIALLLQIHEISASYLHAENKQSNKYFCNSHCPCKEIKKKGPMIV